MIEFTIGTAEERHIKEIALLEHGIFGRALSEKSVAFYVESPVFAVLAAVDGSGSVVGYIVGSLLVPEGEVVDLAVRADMRGRGIGRALLTEFLAVGGRLGCQKYFLEVRASNAAAIGLYRSLGFEEYGIRKGYYDHPTEDALLMQMTQTEQNTQ